MRFSLRNKETALFIIKVITYFIIAGVLILWVVPQYGSKLIASGPGVQSVISYYYSFAVPIFLMTAPLAVVLLILWHVYYETTDPLINAARLEAISKLRSNKKYEPVINALSNEMINEALKPFTKEVKPPLTWSIRSTVRRMYYRKNEVIQ
jgi:hypothetical protein